MKLNGLEKKFEKFCNKNGELIEFNEINNTEYITPLMYAIRRNNYLGLNEEQWKFLFDNTNYDNPIIKKNHTDYYIIDIVENFSRMNISNQFLFDIIMSINNIYYMHESKNGNTEKSFFEHVLLNADIQKYKFSNKEWEILRNKFNINDENEYILSKKSLFILKKINNHILNDKILDKINIKEEIVKKIKI